MGLDQPCEAASSLQKPTTEVPCNRRPNVPSSGPGREKYADVNARHFTPLASLACSKASTRTCRRRKHSPPGSPNDAPAPTTCPSYLTAWDSVGEAPDPVLRGGVGIAALVAPSLPFSAPRAAMASACPAAKQSEAEYFCGWQAQAQRPSLVPRQLSGSCKRQLSTQGVRCSRALLAARRRLQEPGWGQAASEMEASFHPPGKTTTQLRRKD